MASLAESRQLGPDVGGMVNDEMKIDLHKTSSLIAMDTSNSGPFSVQVTWADRHLDCLIE